LQISCRNPDTLEYLEGLQGSISYEENDLETCHENEVLEELEKYICHLSLESNAVVKRWQRF
jgi:hypothetical protein